jgi:hypothetical protein
MIHTQVQLSRMMTTKVYIYDLVVLFMLVQTILGFILWWVNFFQRYNVMLIMYCNTGDNVVNIMNKKAFC